MKQLGIVTFKQATGVKDIRHDYSIVHWYGGPRKPDALPMWRVSAALDSHLRAWWAAALAARNLGCGALQEGYDYIGGTKEWPDLVHVGALAQAAGRTFERRISKFEMGVWLTAMGAKSVKKVVNKRSHRGKVTYTTGRTFYRTSTFRTG